MEASNTRRLSPPARHRQTIAAMIGIYCHAQHRTAGVLCSECQALHDYAIGRVEYCPFGAAKPTCAKCRIHCYHPAMRERVRAVMRYAGPRMLWRHPILALLHQWDAWRGSPNSMLNPSPPRSPRP